MDSEGDYLLVLLTLLLVVYASALFVTQKLAKSLFEERDSDDINPEP